MTHRPALRVLLALLAVAFVVSVAHYVDNAVNYADYPAGGDVPAPSRVQIGVAWFVFTAFGAVGLWLFVRGQLRSAAVCLTAWSVSGPIGFALWTARRVPLTT